MNSESETPPETQIETETVDQGPALTSKITAVVDRVCYTACGDGWVAYRTLSPDKTFYGITQHAAKVALLTHESGV